MVSKDVWKELNERYEIELNANMRRSEEEQISRCFLRYGLARLWVQFRARRGKKNERICEN